MLELFERLEALPLGIAVRDSLWLFPVIEAVHLLGLALLGSAVLAVDLRLLGAGLRARPLAYVARQVNPLLTTAVAMLLVTGVPLFLSEAVKLYWSDAFRLKMASLAVALAFTYGVRRRVVQRDPEPGPWTARATVLGSMALWLTVAASGRWIGFS
ncbi:MAG: DUF6644 family protein [Myxococcota bacterium]